MQYDFDCVRPAFIDFETCSESDLTTVSKYVSHPSTRALTCVVKTEATGLIRLGPYLGPMDLEILAKIAETHTLVAHNAPFDAAIWEKVCKLPEAKWFDTLPACRAAGLPGKLDEVSKRITGRGKDPMGKRLIDLLCKIKPGKQPVPAGPAHKLLMDYNARDVTELEDIFHAVRDFTEPNVVTVDHIINQRGIPANRKRALRLRELYAEHSANAKDAFEQMTFDETVQAAVNPGSNKQVRDWFLKLGFDIKAVNKTVWKEFLQRPESCYVGDGDESEMEAKLSVIKEAMEARREIVRVGGSKVDAALMVMDSDDRMREQLVYWGAHTGRWSARKLQPHNLPSKSIGGADPLDVELTLEGIERAAAASTWNRSINTSDVLGAMVRTIVGWQGPVSFADYGQVELRCTAWLADCRGMLDALADPKASLYLQTAERILRHPITKKDERYAFFKALVLGSIYGMSGAKFEAMCKGRDVDTTALKAAGIDVGNTVKEFRKMYPELPALWRGYQEACIDAVAGSPQEFGRCRFAMVNGHLCLELPSGRCIVYRDAQIQMIVPAWQKMYGKPEVPQPTVTYNSPRGWRNFLYGSKICENVAQATCRDLLATALVNAEQAGLTPFLHVHDELGCETDKIKELLQVMSDPPEWASTFPVMAEGYTAVCWNKHGKQTEYTALRGSLL
jgi:DNA polymerase